MEISEKQHRKVKYTITVLRESLLELMKKNSVEEELLKNMEQELYEEIQMRINGLQEIDGISAALSELCPVIRRNALLCTVLFSDNGDKKFLPQLTMSVYKKEAANGSTWGMISDDKYLRRLIKCTQ